jgi:IS605 OrfB family transposase
VLYVLATGDSVYFDDAYQRFFDRVKKGEAPGYPKFKSKHDRDRSYTTRFTNGNIKVLDKHVRLPKLGLVKCRISRQVEDRILSATVSQKSSGKYFVSITCTDVVQESLKPTGAIVSYRENLICTETLIPKNMVKNRKLAKAISDAAWGEVARQLEYKTLWYGRALIKVDRSYASTQTCNVCGCKNSETKNLTVREWDCPNCGTHHDRDANGARNIPEEGLRIVNTV